MKLLRDSMLAVVILSFWGDLANGQVFGGRAFGEGDSRSTLAINPDGSCVLTNETVQQRKSLEMQITSWERYSKFTEGLGAEDEIAALVASQAKKPELKILTNEELVSKLREMYQQQSGMGGNEMGEVDQVEATTNSVRLVTRRSFASLKELLGQHVYSWGPSIMMFEEARFEIDTNRNVRLTLTPSQNSTRYKKEVSRGWKAAKMKFEWKLIMPGKILSSGLLATEGNATWLSMDGEKQDTVEAGLKLVGLPLVITAEAGGIKLDDSLESKKLVRAAWTQSSGEPDLPITDAGPGFLAEPMSLSISTTHVFPEGKKHFENEVEAAMLGTESSGTLVWAKLFPPKGRQIKSVSGLRVKAAKDDKGRLISTGADESDAAESYSQFTVSPEETEKGGAARVQLRLGLPAPDAKAIEELNCEAVALTIGGWKEMVLTNVQADAKKEIDLGEVLPGAKLIIKKISGKKQQRIIEARLEGPAAVNQLEVKIKMGSRRGGSSNISNQRTTTSGKQTTRSITIRGYENELGDGPSAPLPTLLVRYPQDVKRERVQFRLTTLDLL